MKILSVAGSREIDRRAIEDLGIPAVVLMENAAIGVADAICEAFGHLDHVAIFCGPGNNGGDGYAVARHLDRRGFQVKLIAVGPAPVTDEARLQHDICRRQEMAVLDWPEEGRIDREECDWELAVDALFGLGLSRPLTGPFHAAVREIRERGTPVVAVDLPSGLNGDSCRPLGSHVEADLTVTFETLKPAHVLPPAADLAGEIAIADLGISRAVAGGVESNMTWVDGAHVGERLPARRRDAHKGDFGRVLVVAGSPGFSGAAVLTARTALRCGAGLVTCAVPETLMTTVEAASLETMTLGLPSGAHGGLSSWAVEPVLEAAAQVDTLAIGPGLGSHAETRAAVRDIVLGTAGRVVIDASALDAFAGDLEALRERDGETVLTPHGGELSRLLDRPSAELAFDRAASAIEAAERSGACVVFKGARSLTASPDGLLFVNSSGNSGMATAGTGDVLTGVLAALLALPMDTVEAAACGVWLHGRAGDRAAQGLGEAGMTAGDLMEALPLVLEERWG